MVRLRSGRLALGQLVAAAAVAVVACLPASSRAASVTDPPPPLPSQSGLGGATCTPGPPPSQPWTPVASTVRESTRAYDFAAYQVVVDPWMPCRMYRVRDAQSVERSSDAGRTWQTVFTDRATATSPPGGMFSASHLSVPAPNTVVLGENGNGDAVVRSDDAGRTWRLANNGIAGLPVYAIAGVPGNAQAEYALVTNDQVVAGGQVDPQVDQPSLPSNPSVSQQPSSGPAAFGLYVTADGGATWSPAHLPALTTLARCTDTDGTSLCVRDLLLRVDPQDPRHIFLATNVANALTPGILWESTDSGQTWSFAHSVTSDIQQVIIVRTARHPFRLWLLTSGSGGTVLTMYDGTSWWTVDPGFSSMLNGSLTADPVDADTMLFMGFTSKGHRLGSFFTSDGFETAQASWVVPGSWDAFALQTPLEPSAPGTYGTVDPELLIQGDALGSFYIVAQQVCASSNCTSTEKQAGTYYRQSYWRYAPDRVRSSAQQTDSTGCGPAGCQPPGAGTPTPMLTLRSCKLPPGVPSFHSGTLAFDGLRLLYTQFDETGPAMEEGIIHGMTTDCSNAGDVVVHFSHADLQRLLLLGDRERSDVRQPVVDTMTYDPTRNTLWATVRFASEENNGPDTVPIFTVTIVEPPSPTRAGVAVASLRYLVPSCGMGLLSYDYSDDTLWACSQGRAGHMRASDGGILPTCMDSTSRFGTTQSLIPGASSYVTSTGVATWTIGAPRHMYVQQEDDQTIYQYNTLTCSVEATFNHRPFTEPYGEDEQMACDAVTFTSPVRQSVLWLRDAEAELVTAYAIPIGICPLPTSLRMVATPAVSVGTPVRACAVLRDIHGMPMQGQTLHLTVDGTDAGSGMTDAAGTACGTALATLKPGQHPTAARFAGTSQYIASAASGSLEVLALPPPRVPPVRVLPALARPFTLPPTPPEAPAAPGSAQPAAQPTVQLQLQAQSQVQSQSSAQTQFGVVTQRQRQLQVATAMQTVDRPQTQAAVAWATRVRSRTAAGFVTRQAAGVVLLSLAGTVALSRRRVAAAWARRRD